MTIVYTKPNCVQCNATIRWLGNNGVDYETRPLTDEKIDEFRSAGLTSAPVVEAAGQRWAGFIPDLLKEHALAV